MCGRFTLHTLVNKILQQFSIEQSDLTFEPRYNISPTNSALIVRQVGKQRELAKAKFGLIPSWSPIPKMTYNTTNARSRGVEQNHWLDLVYDRHSIPNSALADRGQAREYEGEPDKEPNEKPSSTYKIDYEVSVSRLP